MHNQQPGSFLNTQYCPGTVKDLTRGATTVSHAVEGNSALLSRL